MRYVVHRSKPERDAYEAAAYAAWINYHSANPAYCAGTLKWSETQQRMTDGKYITPVCEMASSAGYIIEESDPSWFPSV